MPALPPAAARRHEDGPGAVRAGLAEAIAACIAATAPSRAIDARIARAVFPALRELAPVAPGIWRQGDGGRVRALLYSATRAAAATLVPPGCWIESDARGIVVMGPHGAWAGAHGVEPIALCIAALKARLAELSPPS